MTLFEWLLSPEGFPERRFCGSGWAVDPSLVWEHVFFNSLIGLGYWIVAVLLLVWPPIKNNVSTVARASAAAFFILCGGTHIFDIVAFWLPLYRPEARILLPLQTVSVIAFGAAIFRQRKRWVSRQKFEIQTSVLGAIADASLTACYALDTDGRCLYANTEFCDISGHTHEELQGQVMHDLIHHTKEDGDHYPIEECAIYHAMRTMNTTRLDGDIIWDKSGKMHHVSWLCTPVIKGAKCLGARVEVFESKEDRHHRKTQSLKNL